MTEYVMNRRYAEKLTRLMLEHPNHPVIVMIGTDEISDDYAWMAGGLHEPCIEEIIVGHDGKYYTKENEPYDDCYNFYGDRADKWTDGEMEQMAKVIPWESVIAIYVSAT